MSPDRALPTLSIHAADTSAAEPFGLWGRAFRPFFLGLAIYGTLAVPWWTLVWIGALPPPGWLTPMWWHGHEMMFGFVAAAIAGFLLTASPVWTGGGAAIPPAAGLHALTAGAMGATILAVMTRVGLGHTGRPLELPRGVVWCYVLAHAAAAARGAAPFVPGEGQRAWLLVSGLAWAAAFGLFALRYWPILTTPRPDGRRG